MCTGQRVDLCPDLHIQIVRLGHNIELMDFFLSALIGHLDEYQLARCRLEVIGQGDLLLDRHMLVGSVGILPAEQACRVSAVQVRSHILITDSHYAGFGGSGGPNVNAVAHLTGYGQAEVLFGIGGAHGNLCCLRDIVFVGDVLHLFQTHTGIGVLQNNVVGLIQVSAILGSHPGHHLYGIPVASGIHCHVRQSHLIVDLSIGVSPSLRLDKDQITAAVIQSYTGELVTDLEDQIHLAVVGFSHPHGIGGHTLHILRTALLIDMNVGNVDIDDLGPEDDDGQLIDGPVKVLEDQVATARYIVLLSGAGSAHSTVLVEGPAGVAYMTAAGGFHHNVEQIPSILSGVQRNVDLASLTAVNKAIGSTGIGAAAIAIGLGSIPIRGDYQNFGIGLEGIGCDFQCLFNGRISHSYIVVCIRCAVYGIHIIGSAGRSGLLKGHKQLLKPRVSAIPIDPDSLTHNIAVGVPILEGHIHITLITEVVVSGNGHSGIQQIFCAGAAAQRQVPLGPVHVPLTPNINCGVIGGCNTDLSIRYSRDNRHIHTVCITGHIAHIEVSIVQRDLFQTLNVVVQCDKQIVVGGNDFHRVRARHSFVGVSVHIIGINDHLDLELQIGIIADGVALPLGGARTGRNDPDIGGGVDTGAGGHQPHKGNILHSVSGFGQNAHLVTVLLQQNSGHHNGKGILIALATYIDTVEGLTANGSLNRVHSGGVVLPVQCHIVLFHIAAQGLDGVIHPVELSSVSHLEVTNLVVGRVELGISRIHLSFQSTVTIGAEEFLIDRHISIVSLIPVIRIRRTLPDIIETLHLLMSGPVSVSKFPGFGQMGRIGLLLSNGHGGSHIVSFQVDVGIGDLLGGGHIHVTLVIHQIGDVAGFALNDGIARYRAASCVAEHLYRGSHIIGMALLPLGHDMADLIGQSTGIAHQKVIVGNVVVGHQDHQLHPRLVGELLAVRRILEALIDKADVEIVQLIQRHILKADIILLGQSSAVDLLTVGIDHIKRDVQNAVLLRGLHIGGVELGAIEQGASLFTHQSITCTGLLPKSDSVFIDCHNHTDGSSAILIDGSQYATGTLYRCAMRRNVGQEGIGQVVPALVSIGIDRIKEDIRDRVQIQSPSVGKLELTGTEITVLHQEVQIALETVHTSGRHLIRYLLVGQDLSRTNTVTALDGNISRKLIAGILFSSHQNSGTEIMTLDPEGNASICIDFPRTVSRCGCVAIHLDDSVGFTNRHIQKHTVLTPLVSDLPCILSGRCYTGASNIELADLNGDGLHTGNRHDHILGFDKVVGAADPLGPEGITSLLPVAALLGTAGADLAIVIVAEGVDGTIVQQLIPTHGTAYRNTGAAVRAERHAGLHIQVGRLILPTTGRASHPVFSNDVASFISGSHFPHQTHDAVTAAGGHGSSTVSQGLITLRRNSAVGALASAVFIIALIPDLLSGEEITTDVAALINLLQIHAENQIRLFIDRTAAVGALCHIACEVQIDRLMLMTIGTGHPVCFTGCHGNGAVKIHTHVGGLIVVHSMTLITAAIRAIQPVCRHIDTVLIQLGRNSLTLCLSRSGRGVAQTAMLPIAPGVHTLVCGQGNGKVGTGGQAHHIILVGSQGMSVALRAHHPAIGLGQHLLRVIHITLIAMPGPHKVDLNRSRKILLHFVPVILTKLVIPILAPTNDAAIVEQSQGKPAAIIHLEDLTITQDSSLFAAGHYLGQNITHIVGIVSCTLFVKNHIFQTILVIAVSPVGDLCNNAAAIGTLRPVIGIKG